MKTSLIHGGLYKESLRRLRVATILLAAVPAALVITVLLVNLFNSYRDLVEGYRIFTDSYDSFIEVFVLLPALPFVVPVILSAVLFSQQNKRCDSDFYHSLPLTKRQLSITWFAAVVTSTAFVVLASSIAVFAVDIINPAREMPDWDAVVLPVFGALLAALMVAAVLFLSYQISGNAVSALFTTALIVFAPHLITLTLSFAVSNNVWVVSVETLNTFQYFTLFWEYRDGIAWIVTALSTVVCTFVALWLAGRRKSEVAGQAAISKGLQTVLRLTASFIVCLPAVLLWVNNDNYDTPFVWIFYVLAVVVYMLFELFTTKKAKNMIKSLPWLGILAALNIVAVFGTQAVVWNIQNFCPETDEIESVRVTELQSVDYDIGSDACIPITIFHIYNNLYNNSECTEVELTDNASKAAVSKALKENLGVDDAVNDSWYSADMYPYYDYMIDYDRYAIEVEIDTGLITRTRILRVTNAQLKTLLGAIDEIEPLPTSNYYGGEFKPRV